jgi:hypothetical protein
MAFGDRYEIVVQNSTAGVANIAWTMDRDSLLWQVFSNAGSVIVSDDPSLTTALWVAPTATTKGEKMVIWCVSGMEFGIFVNKGTKIYFSFSAKDSATLVCEDQTQPEVS